MRLRMCLTTGITALMLAMFMGCSSTAYEMAAKPSPEMIVTELEELVDTVLDPEGWTTVAPGFRYRHQRGGISFWVTASELTEEGLEQVEAHVEALARSATSEIERFRLREWKSRLEKARADHQNWQIYWPKLQQEYQRAIEEGAIPQGKEGDVTLQPTSVTCSLGASAMPTTASPGAKAYATAYCDPGKAISGFVRTETTARAGSDWPPDCRSDGWRSSTCSNVAYGSYSCYSTALAEYYYRYSSFYFVEDDRYSSNGSCT